MGLFFSKPKNNYAQVCGAKAFMKSDKGNYSSAVRQWSKICSAFLPDQLSEISKNWDDLLSDEKIRKLVLKHDLQKDPYEVSQAVIEVALKKLVAYYVFHTLEVGDNDFLKTNSLTKADFVKQIGEVFDLSADVQKEIEGYITKYGSEATLKFFNANPLTPELSKEFSELKQKEIKSLLVSIWSSTGLINFFELPSEEKMEAIKKDIQMKRIIFNTFLESSYLISK